jgi:phospholipid/cholesterol/gamma-HCH transport system substrate-binding protein
METRASHVAVGAFVLLLLVGGLGFVVWIGKYSEHTAMARHFVRFLESVQGVTVGGNVLFGGIPIGHVTAIGVDPQNTSMARIDLTVDAGAPIRSNSVATLEAQGFTGGVLVEISRGTEDATLVKDGAEIPTRYTAIQHLLAGAPELVARGNELLDDAGKFLTAENIAAAGRIMANFQKFKALVAVNSEKISATLDEVATAAKQITSTNTEYRQLGADLQEGGARLRAQIDSAAPDIRTLSSLVSIVTNSINRIFDENRQAIDQFYSTGLYELPAMIASVNLVVRTVKRISSEIAQDPAQYFLQDRQSGYQIAPVTRPAR